jgi:hypothetical protein
MKAHRYFLWAATQTFANMLAQLICWELSVSAWGGLSASDPWDDEGACESGPVSSGWRLCWLSGEHFLMIYDVFCVFSATGSSWCYWVLGQPWL